MSDLTQIKFKFVDIQPDLINELHTQFQPFPNFEYINDFFQGVEEFDCMVSPANSFGLMDGGIDKAISQFFGWDLQLRVQERILKEFNGIQPVGTSIIVPTNNPDHPWLAHTPTMETPKIVKDTDNAYRAFAGLLNALTAFNGNNSNPIKTVLCPGLGTAVGCMPFKRAAVQMALAYEHAVKLPEKIDWGYASTRGSEIEASVTV
jgi:O-acetyl-ADP-ribose deacetylase (regulator of RNase III)